jgi:hypothetical protein
MSGPRRPAHGGGAIVIGFYMMVSRVLENLEVEIEENSLIDPTRGDGQRPAG